MNYQIIRLLQRIAAESASTAVYMLFNNYRKNNYHNHTRKEYKSSPKKKPYYSADTTTKRPYVPKEKPHKSLLEQTKYKRQIQEKTNTLNGK